jgi:hypothetical protein
LTFRGTDDDVWEKEWDDWINNIAQAFGFAAEQYTKAMQLGDALSRLNSLNNGNLITTGHSLGGGLASAAAVVGGIPAHTFNAAGLHQDTLYERDANGDPLSDGQGGYVELYTGAVARYGASANFIHAFFVDFDVLSAVQDYTPIPNAIGNRHELDGPFDFEMGINGTALGAAIALGQSWIVTWAGLNQGSFMVEAHLHPSILFGLLVVQHWSGVGFTLDVLGYDEYFD